MSAVFLSSICLPVLAHFSLIKYNPTFVTSFFTEILVSVLRGGGKAEPEQKRNG